MTTEKEIHLGFRAGPILSHHDMHEFQGEGEDELKVISEEDLEELCEQIVATKFNFAPYVWNDDGVWKICDAHQRKKALARLESRGYKIPQLQTIEVLADTREEAMRRVLQANTMYGRVTNQGLFAFSQRANLSIGDIGRMPIVGVDMGALKAEFFSQPMAMPTLQSSDRQPFQQMTFTLHDVQADIVKRAMKRATELGAFTDGLNENRNGSALARICEIFLLKHGDSERNQG